MMDYALLRTVAARLSPVAGEEATLEARFLLAYCDAHPPAERDALIERRLGGEPLQYVLGEWAFYGLPMRVDSRALIPRPDTELLVEAAIELLRGGERVLDLCCGSGCIGIAIAKHRTIELISADLSADALTLTKENAAQNGIALETVQSDLFDRIDGTFDLIVSNPPYLNGAEMDALDDALRFEPRLALDGGADGLDFYRRIASSYRRYLRPSGTLLLEIGYTQGDAVAALFDGATVRCDYGNRPRMVMVKHD